LHGLARDPRGTIMRHTYIAEGFGNADLIKAPLDCRDETIDRVVLNLHRFGHPFYFTLHARQVEPQHNRQQDCIGQAVLCVVLCTNHM